MIWLASEIRIEDLLAVRSVVMFAGSFGGYRAVGLSNGLQNKPLPSETRAERTGHVAPFEKTCSGITAHCLAHRGRTLHAARDCR
jgi:hypothetical protein